jgi:large subunit ribosomal protein L4
VAYQAGGRAGTRAQKNRAAVNGGNAKPWRQTGTGRARAGTTRSPLWRGGGKVFPAQTRDFSQKVNRKMHRAAFRSILSELVRQDRLVVVDGLSMDAPKTKDMVALLGRINAPRALVVIEAPDRNLELAARNLPFVHVTDVASADPVSLVGFEKVVMTSGAVRRYEELLS